MTSHPLQPEHRAQLQRGWRFQSPEEGKGKEGSPMPLLVPSVLLSGAGASDSREETVTLPTQ